MGKLINETRLFFDIMDYVGKNCNLSLVEAAKIAKELTDSVVATTKKYKKEVKSEK